jgi:hypothetical protein
MDEFKKEIGTAEVTFDKFDTIFTVTVNRTYSVDDDGIVDGFLDSLYIDCSQRTNSTFHSAMEIWHFDPSELANLGEQLIALAKNEETTAVSERKEIDRSYDKKNREKDKIAAAGLAKLSDDEKKALKVTV